MPEGRGTCEERRRAFYFSMRNHGKGIPLSLAGSLLVAHPNMLDPNFRRAVLFISSHDQAEGAMGVILNRPLDKQVADLVGDVPPNGLQDVPVFLGGPVGKNQLMFAAFEWEATEGLRLNHNVNVEEAHERVDEDPSSIRAFVGYAGWSAGQLEAEMKENAWILQKPTRAALTPERLPKLWFEIMRGLGPWYKLLAAAPDDPSLN
ncbi:MAG: YqgE/AlgH family protein [Chthoniobacterales bacterium]